jgi:PAS domain S-box-containing protein
MKYILSIFFALFGWFIFVAYIFQGYHQYGGDIFKHFLTLNPTELIFHLFVLAAPVGATITTYFIIERNSLLKNIQESEERYQRLSDATLEGISITEKGKFLEMNRALIEMSGYEPSEIIGMDVLKFITPEYHQIVKQKVLSGDERPYKLKLVKKNGGILPVEVCGKPIHYNGRLARITSIRELKE